MIATIIAVLIALIPAVLLSSLGTIAMARHFDRKAGMTVNTTFINDVMAIFCK